MMTITNTITTKKYCAYGGQLCEFANLQGSCTLTTCCKRMVYGNRTEYICRTDRPLVETIYTDGPMIEYAPVKQGKWKVAGNTTHYYICSICGKPGDCFDNYCRSCGAKMDGDDND